MPNILNILKLRKFANAGDAAAEVAISSDTQPRLRIDAGGKLTWGAGGVSAGDTTLYRSATDTLKTDDSFIAAGGLTVKTIEIDPAGASNGNALVFNGTKFAPATPSGTALASVSDTAPSSPTAGQIWFESDTTKSFIYYDSTWVEIGGAGGGGSGASITVSDTAPTSPTTGALWFESDTAKTFIYYDSQWVELNGGTLSSTFTSDTAPASPTVGSLWYETDSGALYVYYDSQWVEVGPGAVYDQILGSIQAKGDLIVGTASQAVSRQAVGSNGQKLVADSSTSTGVAWVSDTTNTAVDAKGDLLVGASDNVLARLPVSTTDGSVLVADSTATNGLSWQTQGVNVRNLLYNGAMQISQRGTSATSLTTSGYRTADRWFNAIGSAGTWTQTVETHTSPTDDIVLRQGFRKSLKMQCTTADASLASSDAVDIRQMLEGQDLQAIRKGTANAQSLTLSFWVKSGKTGTYICEFYDNDNNRSISKSYTVDSAGTWEYKTVTVPPDLTGMFDNDNLESFDMFFWLAAGSNYTSGTLNSASWGTTVAANRAVGQVNLADGTSTSVNYWQITGAQLTVGAIAQPFEFKSYEQELRECQRYYYLIKGVGGDNALCQGNRYETTRLWCVIQHPVTMRGNSNFSYKTDASGYTIYGAGVGDSATAIAQYTGTPQTSTLYFTYSTARTIGQGGWITSADGELRFSAEL